MSRVQQILQGLRKGVRLCCPRCGRQTLFAGYFAMRTLCPHCTLPFEPEPGYFVGAIYINYALTVGIAIAGFFLLEYFAHPSLSVQLLLWGSFCLLFPLWFFRYSKSLWFNIDSLFHPGEEPLTERSDEWDKGFS